jgi:hypothetical protein
VRPSGLVETLAPVALALDSLGVRYFVGGSIASSARGIARASLDVDLVADLRMELVQDLAARLRPTYYVSEGAIRDAIKDRSSFNVVHLGTMMKVDVFVSRGRPWDTEALARARNESLEDSEEGIRFPIASAEDVVLAKLEWYRLGGERSERQWSDVLGVLRTSAETIDRSYLERHAGTLGILDLLEKALDEVHPSS